MAMSAFDPKRTSANGLTRLRLTHSRPLPTSQFDPLRCVVRKRERAMRRRSRAGDKRVKSRRKSATVKHRNAPNMTRKRGASTAGQEMVVAQITKERDEALLRETANAEILSLISRSPDNLELVFQSILENATRICNAKFGTVHLVEGDCSRRTAHHYNTPPAYLELMDRLMRRPGPRTALGR